MKAMLSSLRSENCPSCPHCPIPPPDGFTCQVDYRLETIPRRQRLRRYQSPAALIRPDTARRIWLETPGNPWDVIPAARLAAILHPSLSPLAINDWEWRKYPDRPPLEPQSVWRSGPGGGRVIRKDRAIAWAVTGGRPVPDYNCWDMGSQMLARFGYPGLTTLQETEDQLLWLVKNGIVELARTLYPAYGPWQPYSGSYPAGPRGPWGTLPDLPAGWSRTRFELPSDDDKSSEG